MLHVARWEIHDCARGGGGAGKSSLGYRIYTMFIRPHLEWHANGRPAAVEEQPGQALLGSGGLHDLLQCHPWLPLLPAQDDLPHVQEEIPLSMPGRPYHDYGICLLISPSLSLSYAV